MSTPEPPRSGLFDLPLDELDRFLARYPPREVGPPSTAPRAGGARADETPRQQVILRDETALELGAPSTASLSLLFWESRPGRVVDDRVLLVGPDLDEAPGTSLALAQVVTVRGSLDEATYERYRLLREAVYRARLEGVMIRVRPSQQRVWYRIQRRALERGLNAGRLGAALIAELTALDFVDAAQVLLVTAGAPAVQALLGAAELTLQIVGALTRMHEEPLFDLDCERCALAPVCDSVEELRRLHRRLQGGGQPS